MSDEQLQDFRFRDTTRAPYRSQVNVRFDRFGGDVVAHTADISMEGMFLQSETPRPVGTLVQFELQLDDGQDVIQGLGDVVWVRVQSQGIEKPTGMGIQFRYIDSQSRDRIRRIVGEYIDNEGVPGTSSGSASESAEQPIDLGPAAAGAAAAGVALAGVAGIVEAGGDSGDQASGALSEATDGLEVDQMPSGAASSDSKVPEAPDFLKELGTGDRDQESPLPIDSEWGSPVQPPLGKSTVAKELDLSSSQPSGNEVLPPLDFGSGLGGPNEAATQAIPTLGNADQGAAVEIPPEAKAVDVASTELAPPGVPSLSSSSSEANLTASADDTVVPVGDVLSMESLGDDPVILEPELALSEPTSASPESLAVRRSSTLPRSPVAR